MDPINISRWQNKVRHMFGLRGGNPVPTLLELTPVVVVESDRPEWGWAGGEDGFGHVSTAVGVAAQVGWVGLFNPAGSGVLGVVEFAKNISSIAVTLVVGEILPTGSTTAISGGCRDSRRHNGVEQARAGLRILTGSAAAFSASQAHWQLGVTATVECMTPRGYHAEIGENGFWVMLGGVVNTNVTGAVMWRERAVERGKGT